jgi:hypothetical protein
MLRRYTAMFVAMSASLTDILLIGVNCWEHVWKVCSRRSEIWKQALSPASDRVLVICKLVTEIWRGMMRSASGESKLGFILTETGGGGSAVKLCVLVI